MLAGLTGQTTRSIIAYVLSYVLCPFFGKEKKIADTQIKMTGLNDSKPIFRRNLSHAIQCCIEVFVDFDRHKVVASNESIIMIKKAMASGKPMMTLSGHLGNFELLAAFFARNTEKIVVVGREANFDWFREVVDEVRGKHGVKTAYRGDRNGARALVKAFNSNTVIGFLIDQDFESEQVFHPFFGVPAGHITTPLELAKKYQPIIASAFVVREKDGSHRVHVEEIKVDFEAEDFQTLVLDVYNSRLEELITNYPEQWLWWHRRWRRQPKRTSLPSTSEYLRWLDSF